VYLIDSRFISVDCDTSVTCKFYTLEFIFYTNYAPKIWFPISTCNVLFPTKDTRPCQKMKATDGGALQMVFMVTPQEKDS
jgi:hypothetical protein